MLEDKYIGLAIAVAGNVGIGNSFIFTKKVRRQFSTSNSVLRSSQTVVLRPIGLDSGRQEWHLRD